RALAARLADDARRPGPDPRPGPRRARAGARAGGRVRAAPRRDSRWWGWGDPTVAAELDAEARAMLEEWVGELEPAPLAATIEEFGLPAAEPLPPVLLEAVGAARVFTSTKDRVRHATGRGYPDLARLRRGSLDAAPDAVLLPPDAAAVARVIEVCA